MWTSHADKTFKASHVYWHVFPVQLVQSVNTKFLTYRATARYYKNLYYKNAFTALPKTIKAKLQKFSRLFYFLKFYFSVDHFQGSFKYYDILWHKCYDIMTYWYYYILEKKKKIFIRKIQAEQEQNKFYET